jgi:hypothetical protein
MKHTTEKSGTFWHRALTVSILTGVFICLTGVAATSAAPPLDITAPPGSSAAFGKNLTILSNGNFVVADPDFGLGGTRQGAVYLYDGRTGELISSIAGGVTGGLGDQLGSGGVYALPNGNYVVSSPIYSVGTGLENVGAVSFCSGVSGCQGIAGTGSMRGDVPGERISGSSTTAPGGGQIFFGITVLASGDFVVVSPHWYTNSGTGNSGAVTFCSGVNGCPIAPNASNSLVGARSDYAGAVGDPVAGLKNGVTALSNGKYVVATRDWHLTATARVGAVTLCPATGCTGAISAANSLVGSRDGDWIGATSGGSGVMDLKNGNYVVGSSFWTNPSGTGGGAATGAGAVTFCSGAASGCVGTVGASNSMIGGTEGDALGNFDSILPQFTLLTNKNYVITAPVWDNGGLQNAGAAVWCSGTTGCNPGLINANASHTILGDEGGQNTFNGIGYNGATALANGNYVVISQFYNAGRGAATFCDGTVGCQGSINTNVSLVGTATTDNVGSGGVAALTNGNYVVRSAQWSGNNASFAGAVTWCDGATGCGGAVTTANSLYGSHNSDNVGSGFLAVLPNGRYVVSSPAWDNAPTADVGASTFCGSVTGCTGAVSTANSLIGTTAGDRVGTPIVLSGGNYLVRSSSWDNGARANVGALTWCNGATGCGGTVTTANSLYGSTAADALGNGSKFLALPNGGYAFDNFFYDNGAVTDAGALVFGKPDGSTVGEINADNALRGNIVNPSPSQNFTFSFFYDAVNRQLVVGRPLEGKVTIYRQTRRTEFDFDADGRADLAVFRPSGAAWFINPSSSPNNFHTAQFGAASDKLAPADYDGDGKTDLAVWRETEANFYILNSSNGAVRVENFGLAGDVLTVGDWDGDGKADLSTYRDGAQSYFFYRGSLGNPSGNITYLPWGVGGDKPLRGDFDGDGRQDAAVYRASNQTWYIRHSSDGQAVYRYFGLATDRFVPADFDGDGRTDVAVFRPSNSIWYILRSSNGEVIYRQFGLAADVPAPADYDGDGLTDIAVFRNGAWFILQSSSGQVQYPQFGQSGDLPAASAFTP